MDCMEISPIFRLINTKFHHAGSCQGCIQYYELLIIFSIICDRLWENPAKIARQNSEKKGKSNKKICKDAPLIHFIHPKVQKYVEKCLKIAPNVIKINSIPI
jgi:hypothetical protein